jgi:ESAT-6 protein secretion system EspG family protein
MAVVDLEAGRVRLTERELAAAVMLATEPGSPKLEQSVLREDVARLTEAGLVKDGTLDPALANLVSVVARPQLRLMLERVTDQGLSAYAVWATPKTAVLAVPVPDEPEAADYAALEPMALPLTLFGLAGMSRRPVPRREGSIEIQMGDLDAANKAGEARDAAGVDAALQKAGIDEPWRAALARMILEREGSWRLSGGWADAKGQKHLGSLTIVDAGKAGLWRVEAPPDPAPDDPTVVIKLTPVAPSTVWKELLALLPLGRAAGGH